MVSSSSNHRADRWRPADHPRETLVEALVRARIAGPVTSHDRDNVRWKLGRLVQGDPDLQFGIEGLAGLPYERVLGLMADAAGFDPDPRIRFGPTPIDPWRVLESCEDAGRLLTAAALRGERVLLATGHPVGLSLLYAATGELLEEHGAKLLQPADGVAWAEDGRHREIRYRRGVATAADGQGPIHTHSPEPMRRILEEAEPDLVFADHGFAGAAIQAGIETISVADVNDPAPVVARWQGRARVVIVMDDNVAPQDYWPCFQAIAAQFPR